MTKYEIILYWSEEDQAFVAEVPELPGCAADGSTRQKALANAETVIAEWLETARELGRDMPAPKGRHARAIARIVPEVNRRQEEIDSAIEGIMALRKRNGKITFEELRSAREEGRKY